MIENELVEKAAVAIGRADADTGYDYDHLGIDHPEVSDWSIHLARAAIAATEAAAPVTDAMIEAGVEARDKIHNAMRDRNLSDEPEDMPDYDEGDVMRAIFEGMFAARALPSPPQESSNG